MQYLSPDVSLINISNNVLLCFNKNISLLQTTAVCDFLTSLREIPRWQVRKLAIDSCLISDEAAAKLLEGIYAQGGSNGTAGGLNE